MGHPITYYQSDETTGLSGPGLITAVSSLAIPTSLTGSLKVELLVHGESPKTLFYHGIFQLSISLGAIVGSASIYSYEDGAWLAATATVAFAIVGGTLEVSVLAPSGTFEAAVVVRMIET